MTKDYIREAIELADGFTWIGERYLGRTDDPKTMVLTPLGIELEANDSWLAVMVAAQLVRQVDALVGSLEVQILEGETGIFDYATNVIVVPGEDRTENTIKAIIDSKVLSND